MTRPRFTIGRFLLAQVIVAFFLGIVATIAVPSRESIALALATAILPAMIVLLSSSASDAFKTIAAIAIGVLVAIEILSVVFVLILLAALDLGFLLIMAACMSLTSLVFLGYDTWIRPRALWEVRFLDDPPPRR